MRITCPLAIGLLPFLAAAADLPPRVLPAGVGVNIHFVTGHGRDLDLIAAAGFKFIRMDFGWHDIERQQGQYDWSRYDELTANLEQRGIRPYYILDYSNPLYEEVVTSRNPLNGREQRDLASPQHPESVAAFARWAGASARHFRGHRVIWEIWNEPNISFWKPKPSVEQYTALALAACRAVREADSQTTIVGPATSGFPWDYLETFLKSGVLEYLDAVSVHPYRDYKRSPETAAADYQRLRGLIERYAPNGTRKRLPILSGEWGYATHAKGLSPETQAAFLVRQQLSNLLNGVPVSIWYDWQNDGPDPNEREHNFGTVTMGLEPKPAYLALKTMTQELSGYHVARRLALADDQDYALLLVDSAGRQRIAAWTTGNPHEVSLEIGGLAAKNVSAINGRGAEAPVTFAPHRLTLELGAAPVYLRFTKHVRLK